LSIFDLRSGRVPDSTEFVFEKPPSPHARLWAAEVAEMWPEAHGLGAAMCAEQARVFSSNFPDMLSGLRAVRNAIAHEMPVAEDDLTATLSIAQGLEAFLLDRFSHWRTLDVGQDIGPRIGSEI
jgi:hypothetical protein